jgi:hypothetical protein
MFSFCYVLRNIKFQAFLASVIIKGLANKKFCLLYNTIYLQKKIL